MNKITLAPKVTGKQEESRQDTGLTVPVEFVEKSLTMRNFLGDGEADGRKFEVLFGFNGKLVIEIEGLEGQLPRFEVSIEDMVKAAFESAKENNLLK